MLSLLLCPAAAVVRRPAGMVLSRSANQSAMSWRAGSGSSALQCSDPPSPSVKIRSCLSTKPAAAWACRASSNGMDWSCSPCAAVQASQDRGATTGEVLHQGHVLALALQQHNVIVGAHVAHPVRPVAKHGHQIAVSPIGDDNHGKRDRPSGGAASNLDCGSLVWSDTRRKGDAKQAA
jgi:hypothetical protein